MQGTPLASASRREWVGLAVLALPCVLFSIDVSVLYLATPALTRELQPSGTQLLWIADIYGFLLAGSLITMGTLGDRIGRRKMLLFGSAAFGAASVLAAFAPTAELLIVARGILGIAGATLAPSALSLIRTMFRSDGQRAFAISVWCACLFGGAVIGPLIGGLLLEHFWWGSVFLAAVPVMILFLVLGMIFLPESRDPRAGRLDFISAVLSVAGVLSVIYGIKLFAAQGASWTTVAALLAGTGISLIYVRRQQQLRQPMIDLALFRVPGLGALLTINLLNNAITLSVLLFSAQYLQLVLGIGSTQAGLLAAVWGVALAAGSMSAPIFIARVRPAHTIAGGFIGVAVGLLVLTQVSGPGAFWILLAGLVMLSLGIAPASVVTTNLVIGSAPPERAGAAVAISEMSFELGGALGIAIIGSIATAIYRTGVASTVPPDIPRATVQAALETLGGAAAAAANLSGEAGAALLASARDAFSTSFAVTTTICTGIAVAAAILALTLLGRVNRGGDLKSLPS